MESLCLEIFKTCLHAILHNALQVTLLSRGVGLDARHRSSLTSVALWFWVRLCKNNKFPCSERKGEHNGETKIVQRKMFEEFIIGILQEQHLGLQMVWKTTQDISWKKVCAGLHHCEIVCKKQHRGDQWQHHLLWGIPHKSNSSEDEWTITLKASKTFIHFKLDTGAHDGVLIEIMLSSWQEADNRE